MRLRGINLGGWLLMEGYILRGRNVPESDFKRAFKLSNSSDSNGKALLWERPAYRKRTIHVLETLADRYCNAPALACYDILNEPVLEDRSLDLLTFFYRDAIRRIRAINLDLESSSQLCVSLMLPRCSGNILNE